MFVPGVRKRTQTTQQQQQSSDDDQDQHTRAAHMIMQRAKTTQNAKHSHVETEYACSNTSATPRTSKHTQTQTRGHAVCPPHFSVSTNSNGSTNNPSLFPLLIGLISSISTKHTQSTHLQHVSLSPAHHTSCTRKTHIHHATTPVSFPSSHPM